MIALVDSALLALQRALAARSLYSPKHPAVHAGENEAHEHLRQVLGANERVEIIAGYDRVLWGDRPLPASKALSRELFSAVRRVGVDRITFRRELTAADLGTLLDALSGETSIRALEACPGLELGHIAEVSGPEGTVTNLQDSGIFFLAGLHETISAESEVDTQTLEQMVAVVSTVVSSHAHVLLPLLETKRHDEYTFVHTTNVAILSTALAEALGFDRTVAGDITIAALLHDVGKQAVPEEILNRKGRLTDEERLIIQSHPVVGAQMLLTTPGVSPLAPIVAYEHHMRSDGGGYPRARPGWKLNLASRIVQMADVFDALRTNRPYRAALPLTKITEIMRSDFDGPLDSWLLDILFRDVVDRDGLATAAEKSAKSRSAADLPAASG